jgi:hypothetical protein
MIASTSTSSRRLNAAELGSGLILAGRAMEITLLRSC